MSQSCTLQTFLALPWYKRNQITNVITTLGKLFTKLLRLKDHKRLPNLLQPLLTSACLCCISSKRGEHQQGFYMLQELFLMNFCLFLRLIYAFRVYFPRAFRLYTINASNIIHSSNKQYPRPTAQLS